MNYLDNRLTIEESLIIYFDEFVPKDNALRQLAERLTIGGYVEENFADSIITREKKFPTGLPMEIGMAIPHTDVKYVKKNALAFGVLSSPVEFVEMGSVNGKKIDVYLIYMLAISNKEAVIDVLSKLMSILTNNEFQNSMKDLQSSSRIFELLKISMPGLLTTPG